jgi:hypothetical protein
MELIWIFGVLARGKRTIFDEILLQNDEFVSLRLCLIKFLSITFLFDVSKLKFSMIPLFVKMFFSGKVSSIVFLAVGNTGLFLFLL